MTTDELNTLWGRMIIEELVRFGVEYFCISPGSRSTPLTAAVARHASARSFMHFDERGAAFHAVGYARGSGRPAAVICTSGTAAASYYPAIVEAANDSVPLVVVTADRPPDLRHTGANQTIDQVGLYAEYPRWQHDLLMPSRSVDPLNVLEAVDTMMGIVSGAHPGPVHLNCPFPEPLIGSPEDSKSQEWPPSVADWAASGKPLSAVGTSARPEADSAIAQLATSFSHATRGILVVGRLHSHKDRLAIKALIERSNWPALVDSTSGLRAVRHNQVINHFDLALLSESFAESMRPDVVLHVGGRVVSKRLNEAFAAWKPNHHIHVDATPEPYDPAHSVTQHVTANLTHVCDKLTRIESRNPSTEYLARWQKANADIGALLENACSENSLTESQVAWQLSQLVSPESALWLASSMPIRDFDMFARPGTGAMYVSGNRGASGIDGTIASAAGYAVGLDRPVTTVTGDLAFLHDLNSLAMLSRIEQPVTVVLLNNNGGRIFEHLPIAKHDDIFEKYFATPHELASFEPAARQFGLRYGRVNTVPDFIHAYRNAVQSHVPSILEVTIDTDQSVAFRTTVRKRIVEIL